MNRVDEIERAILELSPDDFAHIAKRVQELEQERWDNQLDEDSSSGKLDFLREEAKDQHRDGLLRDWPHSSS